MKRKKKSEELEAFLDAAAGISPEAGVSTWWDGLSIEKRREIGSKLYGDRDDADSVKYWSDYWDWSLPWKELVPLGQQMRIHIWYDSNRPVHRCRHGRDWLACVECDQDYKNQHNS
jgi:hypothetical protein